MWESLRSTSHGGFSVRRIISAALAILTVAFLWIIVNPQTTFAADASWSGSNLTYNNNTYSGPAPASTVSALNLPGAPTAYTYIDTTPNPRLLHVLYFAPGTTPSTASTVYYKTYRYNGPTSFSNPSSVSTVAIVAPGSTSPTTTPSPGTTSCAVDGGLGWIICPVSNSLAAGMDMMFNILADFLEVRKLEITQDSAMYRAWGYMRTFANVAFVIAFLIIIYSQLTSLGLSNYGLKKLLPRIIIAAILVNLSFIICATVIDLSNLLGYSLQNVFIAMREMLVGAEGANWDLYTWESITQFVLAGGTAAAAGGVVLFTTIATYGAGTIFLILPVLLGVFIALLVALLIIAARQAIITILTIVSPLAFVAYLLPNTEKWFDKWRGLFMTMLIFFPAFSIVFGGSQLAGAIIIQNANSINLVVLGMAVQVAPLVITPLLLKLSGNLLSRIAGIVNNPNKGIIDRTRNWSKDRADASRERRLNTPAASHQLMKRVGQSMEHNRRRREGWKNAYKAMGDATWANSQDYRAIDHATRRATEEKQLGETLSEQHYTIAKTGNAQLKNLDIAVREAKLNLDNAKVDADIQNWEKNHAAPILQSRMREMTLKEEVKRLHDTHEIEFDEFKSGQELHLPISAANRELQERAMRNADVLSANALRKASAQRVLTDQFAKKLEENSEQIDGSVLQKYAGGIDPNGAQRALATSLSAQSKAFNEAIDTANAILVNKNYSDQLINDIALDKYTGNDIDITPEMRLAALRRISKGGNAKEIIRLTEELDINDSIISQDFRQEIADNILMNGNKPKWIGASVSARIKSGEDIPAAGTTRTDQWIIDAFSGGKLNSADLLVSHDNDYLTRIAQTIRNRPGDFNLDPYKRAEFMKQIKIALTDQRYSGRLGERKATIKAMRDALLFPDETLDYVDD